MPIFIKSHTKTNVVTQPIPHLLSNTSAEMLRGPNLGA